MSKRDNLKDFFTDLADAIREREGSTNKINPQDMAVRIAAICDKEVIKIERTTLKELLYDIAEAIRTAEDSSLPINPQDMSSRVLALVNDYLRWTFDKLQWIGDDNNEGVIKYNTLTSSGKWELEEVIIEELL